MIAAAYKALDVTEAEVSGVPPFTDILKQSAGGLAEVLRAMRRAETPAILKFLRRMNQEDARFELVVPWEAYCAAAKVKSMELFGETIRAMAERNADIVKVLMSSNHPGTVKARIKNALKPQGVRDRDSIDRAMRLLPTPKTSMNVFMNAQDADGGNGGDDGGIDANDLFPDLEETQKKMLN